MKLSLKILENNSQIEKSICVALLPQVTTYFNNVVQFIKLKLPILLKSIIIESPEYLALTKGNLRLELGIPDAEMRIDDIIDTWLQNMVIQYKPPQIQNNKIKTSLSIEMIKSDFSDVISLSSAEIQDNISGSIVPWLRWLLLEGTATLVKNYEVTFGPNSRSRTGFAVMTEAKNQDWGVPAEYAGTSSDNWITRTIERSKQDINKLIVEALSQ
ncbi:hypothetical protein EB118_15300 [bacterium]|nr:hypothetical protein [bacterium]NDC95890.1 hypothetical protein [bacterium]NDD85213.1 hypothetical protein [bacterium]NDG31419.1 hypothetical protein [bacterium]